MVTGVEPKKGGKKEQSILDSRPPYQSVCSAIQNTGSDKAMLENCVDLSTFAFLSFSVNEFKNSMVTTKKKTDEHFVLTLITESNVKKKNDNNHSDVSVPHSLAINSTFQLYEE